MVSWNVKTQEIRVDRFVLVTTRRTEKKRLSGCRSSKQATTQLCGCGACVPGTAELALGDGRAGVAMGGFRSSPGELPFCQGRGRGEEENDDPEGRKERMKCR